MRYVNAILATRNSRRTFPFCKLTECSSHYQSPPVRSLLEIIGQIASQETRNTSWWKARRITKVDDFPVYGRNKSAFPPLHPPLFLRLEDLEKDDYRGENLRRKPRSRVLIDRFYLYPRQPTSVHWLFLSILSSFLSSVQPSPSIFLCSSSFPCSLPLPYFRAPSFSPPSRGTLIMVLFTAARFSVKTGRTRSKGYQVWRSGRPEREAQPTEKMGEERGGRLTRDRVTISTKER